MINKLYQIDLLTAKEAVIMPKDGPKVMFSKLNQNQSNQNIEFKVSKIVKKPYDIDRVREMFSNTQNNNKKNSQS